MEFVQLYADVDNDIDIDDDDGSQVLVSKNDYTLIDDSEQINGNDADFFRGFENVTRNLNEPINDHEHWIDKRDHQPENYLSHEKDKNEMKFDEFYNVEARNKKFTSKMLIYQKGSKDSFYNGVLYAFAFKMSKKSDFVTDESKIEAIIGTDTYKKSKKNKRRPKA